MHHEIEVTIVVDILFMPAGIAESSVDPRLSRKAVQKETGMAGRRGCATAPGASGRAPHLSASLEANVAQASLEIGT